MKIRSTGVLLLIPAIVAGCSLLKNTTTQSDRDAASVSCQTRHDLLENKDWSEESGYLILDRDSIKADYVVQLWPKGVFTLSADSGFKGEAGRILISGNKQRGTNSIKYMTRQERDEGRTAQSLKENVKIKTERKKVEHNSSPSLKLIVSALVVLLFTGYYMFKK